MKPTGEPGRFLSDTVPYTSKGPIFIIFKARYRVRVLLECESPISPTITRLLKALMRYCDFEFIWYRHRHLTFAG